MGTTPEKPNNVTSAPHPNGQLPLCGSNFCPKSGDSESQPPSVDEHNDGSMEIYKALGTHLEPSRMYTLVAIHTAATIIGTVILILLVDNICEDYSSNKSLLLQAWHSIHNSLRQLKRNRQILMTPLNIYTGLSKSFMLADITQAFIGCVLGVEMIGYGSVLYSLVSCTAAILSGFLLQRMNRKSIFLSAAVISVLNFILLLMWIPNTTQLAVLFLIPVLWALPDGIFISQMNTLYGYIFHDNTQGAFASFRFWESIGLVLGYICNTLFCVKYKLYLLMALLALGMTGYLLTERVQLKLNTNKLNLQTSIEHLTLSFSNIDPQDSFNTCYTPPGNNGNVSPGTGLINSGRMNRIFTIAGSLNGETQRSGMSTVDNTRYTPCDKVYESSV